MDKHVRGQECPCSPISENNPDPNPTPTVENLIQKLFDDVILARDERTRVSDVYPCPSPCPRFSDMPLSELVSVSEVMTLSESMSESVSEVQKNLVSVSESTSEIEIFYLSESVSESMSEP